MLHQRKRQRLWLLTGAGAVLGLAVLVFLLVRSGSRPADTEEEREPQPGKRERTSRDSSRKPKPPAHDAVGARVTIVPDPPGYPGPGAKGLTDGLLAIGDDADSAGWVGWHRSAGPIEVTLDLAQPTKVTRLGAHFLRALRVGLPMQVEFAVSEDGKQFRTVATVLERDGLPQRGWYTAAVDAVTARRVRVSATPGGEWTYLDEVAVNPQPDAPQLRHAARGRPVKLVTQPSRDYPGTGIQGLTDGFVARSPDFGSLHWLGIEGKNLDATIDLGGVQNIREVGAHFLQVVKVGIHMPWQMDVLVSDDGKEFRNVAIVKHTPDGRPVYMKALNVKLKDITGRFVKVVAYTNGLWLFADEIFVNPEPAERD
jgi:hypothetical protein